ncbi:MAG: M48 family metallopeptidase [Acidobacteria bacterium]|nr:M48 family metallopeptidase [Acidobacteriota bacterium]
MIARKWLLVTAILLALPGLLLAKEDDKKKPKKKKDDVEAIGERDVDGKLNFYSIEKEIALGKAYADEVVRTSKMVRDPIISEYVNRIGQNLARNSDGKVPFQFQVVDDESVNAFALPGGFVFVNTGLLVKADTESEVAGVLAHEIAHVAARHGTRQATKGQLANLSMIPLMILTGGWTGFGIQQAASFAIPIAFLQFSKGMEAQADFLGLQYLYKAGYDPIAFVDFFEKLQAMEKTKPGALAGVFRSHPMTEDRIEAAQKEIERILPDRPEYVVDRSEFFDVKDRFVAISRLRKEEEKGDGPRRGPVLRRGGGTVSTETIEANEEPVETGDSDERPTLKRK